MEKKKMFSVVALAATIINAMGQSADSTRQINLTEVNVVASRSEKNNFETPRSVTVITADQIKQAGYLSVADVLNDAGGIYLTGPGQNPGANESIFMRGANSNQTAILIDGVRISDASTVNNTIDLSELSLDDVDRIEIIRGSHSTLYGSAAIGGVISIIKKHGNTHGLHGNVSVTGGTFGTKSFYKEANGSLNYTFKNGIFADAGAEKILSDGIDATLDTVTDPAAFKHRDKDNWDRLMWFASAGCHREKFKLDLSYRATDMKTDLDVGAYQDDDNYVLDFKRNLMNGNFLWKFNSIFSTQLNAGYTDTKRNSVNDSSVTDAVGTYDHNYIKDTYNGKFTTADWQLNAHFSNADLVAGFSYKKEEMNQQDNYYNSAYMIDSKTNLDTITPAETFAGFLQMDLKSSLLKKSCDKLNLVTGVRFNHHTVSGDQLTYEINPGYKVSDDALIYLSWSTGFNTPSLYQFYAPETYVPWDGGDSTNLTRGNKNLKPETSSSFELGFKQKVNNKIQYDVSYFYSVTENLIEYVYLWNKAIGFDTLGNDWGRDDYRGDRYLNIGKQTTTGIEVSVTASLNDKLKLIANASLVSGTIEYNSSSSIEGQSGGEHVQLYSNGTFLNGSTKTTGLVRRPNEASLTLIYSPITKISFIPSLRYVGSRNDIYYDSSLGPYGALGTNVIEGYTLLNLSVQWKVRNHLAINLRGENLADVKYEEIHGFSTKGRSVYASVRFSF